MRIIHPFLLFCLLTVSTWAATKNELTGTWADLNGKQVAILGEGKYVLMDFWASWCVPCRIAAPDLNKLIPKFPELRIIGVNVDEPEGFPSARTFVRNAKLQFPSVIDIPAAMSDHFQVEGVPTMILLDPAGNELHRWIGEPPDLAQQLQNLIRKP